MYVFDMVVWVQNRKVLRMWKVGNWMGKKKVREIKKDEENKK